MNLPWRPLSSNFTIPSTSANSVSSLPRPTFLPGFHFVPRWRARMLPPKTCSPPNFFKPKRCECESRPLRDEPTPFLRAIVLPPEGIFDLRFLICDFADDCRAGSNQQSKIANQKSYPIDSIFTVV